MRFFSKFLWTLRLPKMADAHSKFVPRFSVMDVLDELRNDANSDDNDMYSGSESEEEEDDVLFPTLVYNALAENDNVDTETGERSSSPAAETDNDSDYEPDNRQK